MTNARAPRRSSRRPDAAAILWLVNVAVVAAMTVEIGSRAFVYAFENWRPDYRAYADGYEGAGWTAAYYRELRASGTAEWRPYVYWRRPPYAGQHINVDTEGIRRSWQPEPSAGQPRVFVMGGSTVWGTGSRDEYTLPSEISKQLAAAGHRVTVSNYGESGYVSSQSVAAVLHAVRSGNVPGLVAIYGGAEDVFSAYQNGAAGLPQNEINRRQEFNSMQPTAIGRIWPVLTSGTARAAALILQRPQSETATAAMDGETLAAAVVDTYCANVRALSAIGNEFGFRVAAFWQPTIFAKRSLTAYEQGEAARSAAVAALYRDANRLIAASPAPCAGTSLHDASGIFRDQRDPRFVDALHPTELGNRELAAASLPALVAALTTP